MHTRQHTGQGRRQAAGVAMDIGWIQEMSVCQQPTHVLGDIVELLRARLPAAVLDGQAEEVLRTSKPALSVLRMRTNGYKCLGTAQRLSTHCCAVPGQTLHPETTWAACQYGSLSYEASSM